MVKFILRRLIQIVPILLGVSIILFIIVHSVPGDPYAYLFGPRVDPTLRDRLMEEMGFNDPLPVQYVRWLSTTLQGNLGYSIRSGQAVADMMADRIPNTLILAGAAFLISIIISVPLGILSATRPYSFLDYAATAFAFAGISLPSFFAALVMIYIFAVKLQRFPMNQITTPGAPFSLLDLLHHLVLPATALGLRDMAAYVRYTRSSMLEVLRQDYIRTARSKGLAEQVVIYKHALRNALIPIVTMAGLNLPILLSGAVVFESLFTWSGMGLLTFEAIGNRDYSILMAVNLFFTVLVILGNLAADVIYAVVDPRIRYS